MSTMKTAQIPKVRITAKGKTEFKVERNGRRQCGKGPVTVGGRVESTQKRVVGAFAPKTKVTKKANAKTTAASTVTDAMSIDSRSECSGAIATDAKTVPDEYDGNSLTSSVLDEFIDRQRRTQKVRKWHHQQNKMARRPYSDQWSCSSGDSSRWASTTRLSREREERYAYTPEGVRLAPPKKLTIEERVQARKAEELVFAYRIANGCERIPKPSGRVTVSFERRQKRLKEIHQQNKVMVKKLMNVRSTLSANFR